MITFTKTVRHEADRLLSEFNGRVIDSIREMHERMEQRTTIDALEAILDGVFFRNCHIFEVISFLIENRYVIGAEYLARSLFEGTVLLEWCLVDPRERGLRFFKTTMQGELDLTRAGFLEQPAGRDKEIQDALNACGKGLPDFRSMLESLDTYKRGSAYHLYQYLSKEIHGTGSSWGDFLDCSGERARVCSVRDPSVERLHHARAIACFLSMRNVVLVSSFDTSLHYPGCAALQKMWESIYALLWIQDSPLGRDSSHDVT